MASQVDDTGAKAEIEASHNYVWDTIGLTWVRMTQPGGVGGGGGGPATIADGADVAQGATSDTSAASTVVGILKAIKAAVQGTLTVATHAVTQSGVWTVARSWSLSSATDSVNVGNFPATQPVSGTVGVNNFPASQAVTGTFFQATQPVSLATNTPDVTDRAARLLGHVTVDSAPTTAVTGTFFQATQPVSIAAAVDVSDRAARLLGHITDDTASLLCVTTTAATGVAATLTIPAAGAGLFHYIDYLEISLYATAARTGGATPILVTTTNLPGSPVWDFETAQAIGAMIRQQLSFGTPLKSSAANTATTVVAPIATTGIWRITAFYHAAV